MKKMVRDFEFRRGRYNQNNYQKTMFYTNWLDEPVELDANRFQQILKIWQNVLGRIRNPWKKWCAIPSSDEGDMTKTITKKQCSTPANLMNRLNWMATGCKIFWKFDIMFLEE